MTLVGILIGLLNCLLLAVILVLVGAIVQWLLVAFGWPPPANVVKLYMAIVALITVICVITLLLGAPMFHLIHVSSSSIATAAAAA